MKKDKVWKYLKHAIREIILVVIGILIALQINNWNEDRKNNKVTEAYYHQILVELKKDSTDIQNRIVQLDSSILSFNKYMNEFNDQKNIGDLISSQAKLQFSPSILKFNTNVIETLQSTGDIKLIPFEIRNKLVDLKNNQKAWIEVISVNNNLISKDIMSVINLGLSNNILSSANNPSNQIFTQLKVEDNFPKIALTLNGVLGLKNGTEEDLKEGLVSMLTEIDEISILIMEEAK